MLFFCGCWSDEMASAVACGKRRVSRGVEPSFLSARIHFAEIPRRATTTTATRARAPGSLPVVCPVCCAARWVSPQHGEGENLSFALTSVLLVGV